MASDPSLKAPAGAVGVEETAAARAPQAAGDARRDRRDARPGRGTGGARGVTNGERLAWAIGAVAILAVTTVNVFSELYEKPELDWWEPAIWEYSSAIAAIGLLFVPLLAFRLAPLGRSPWVRFLTVHAVASVLFSVSHVVLFVGLRQLAYALGGERYPFDWSLGEFLYEYRKDLLGYTAGVLILWLLPVVLARRAPAPDARPASDPALYDIRDGARLLRVPPGDILAATSAGNYVEFALADGRKPLARATLASVEADLAPHGVLRVHRSWLVNAARVRTVTPDGSGDHTLELEGGLVVPLSRRFPRALERLRRPARTGDQLSETAAL